MKLTLKHVLTTSGVFAVLAAAPLMLIHAQDAAKPAEASSSVEDSKSEASGPLPAPEAEAGASAPPGAGSQKVVEGIAFVWCPPGTFQQGFAMPDAEFQERFRGTRSEWYADARPAHEVTIEEGFWLSRTEITREQWRVIMGTDPWREAPDAADTTLPVAGITWDDCQTFTKKLQQKAATRFRLPTESEWEYACRAGTETVFYFGDDHRVIDQYAWNWGNTTNQKSPWPKPVGVLKPNAWGLHDMLGNVWEWCLDGYAAYASDLPGGRAQEHSGGMRVVRGGSYMEWAVLQLPSYRSAAVEDSRNPAIGFRVVMEESAPSPAAETQAAGG